MLHAGNVKYPVVLFDIDGTLLDTREFVLASFEFAFVSLGFAPPTREMLVPQIGRRLEDIYADFAGGEFADDLTEIHRSFQTANLNLAVAYEGVPETLASLDAEGVRMAAITSRSRRTSIHSLDRAGIGRFFDTVISAEDTPALKPDPAPLLAALEALGLTPDAGVAMVGDTAHDIQAGRAIGALTIAAAYGFHGDTVHEATPDVLINDIAELPAALGLPGPEPLPQARREP